MAKKNDRPPQERASALATLAKANGMTPAKYLMHMYNVQQLSGVAIAELLGISRAALYAQRDRLGIVSDRFGIFWIEKEKKK